MSRSLPPSQVPVVRQLKRMSLRQFFNISYRAEQEPMHVYHTAEADEQDP